MSSNSQTGNLFIISAPSGAGKTTLCRALLSDQPDLRYSISHTTRAPRAGEQDGTDYFFISQAEFEDRIRRNAWAEWAKVHDNYYGTSVEFIEKNRSKGIDLLLDIDVQGMTQIIRHYPKSITIFIRPPSLEILKKRLTERGTEAPEVIEKRLRNAQEEMKSAHLYRHIIVNDQLTEAVRQLTHLVRMYRHETQKKTHAAAKH